MDIAVEAKELDPSGWAYAVEWAEEAIAKYPDMYALSDKETVIESFYERVRETEEHFESIDNGYDRWYSKHESWYA